MAINRTVIPKHISIPNLSSALMVGKTCRTNLSEKSVKRIPKPYGSTNHKPVPKPVWRSAANKLPIAPIPMQIVLPNRKARMMWTAYNKILLLHKVRTGNIREDTGKISLVPVTGSTIINRNVLNNIANKPAKISKRNLDKMALVLERSTKILWQCPARISCSAAISQTILITKGYAIAKSWKKIEISPLRFHHLPRGVVGCY